MAQSRSGAPACRWLLSGVQATSHGCFLKAVGDPERSSDDVKYWRIAAPYGIFSMLVFTGDIGCES